MLMQLRDAGKVSLDDPVSKYLPSFRITSRFPDSPPITLLQIATHTSGFPREAPLDYWRTLKFPPVESLISAVSSKGDRAFPAYVERKYSNVGYAILGRALSQAAGEPYFSYVDDHILKPQRPAGNVHLHATIFPGNAASPRQSANLNTQARRTTKRTARLCATGS